MPGVERAFVGREAELDRLGRALAAARAGTPQRVLVEGPGGIGKTALVRRFLDTGGVGQVLAGSGEEAESAFAFGVLEQLLGVRDGWPDPLAGGAALVDAIGEAQDDLKPPEDAVAVVLDDAQWADHPSLHALSFAVRRLRADRVLAVLVVRDADDPDLPAGVRRLWTGDGVTRLRLTGLEPAELRDLSGLLSGLDHPLSARAAVRLHQHTAGNPLYAKALLEQSAGLVDDLEQPDAALPAPASHTALVLAALGAVAPPAEGGEDQGG
ncbi:AAA family ATPase, partial [Streptomyces sp. A7024]